jgi:hypothetical protein
MEVSGQLHAPVALPPGKNQGTHWIGGWVGPRAGVKKFLASTGIRNPNLPVRSLVAIPKPLDNLNYLPVKNEASTPHVSQIALNVLQMKCYFIKSYSNVRAHHSNNGFMKRWGLDWFPTLETPCWVHTYMSGFKGMGRVPILTTS